MRELPGAWLTDRVRMFEVEVRAYGTYFMIMPLRDNDIKRMLIENVLPHINNSESTIELAIQMGDMK